MPLSMPHYLPHTVEPLEKDWRPLLVRMVFISVAASSGDHMTEAAPILLDENCKPLKGAIIRI